MKLNSCLRVKMFNMLDKTEFVEACNNYGGDDILGIKPKYMSLTCIVI